MVLVDEGKHMDNNHPMHMHGYNFRVVAMEKVNNKCFKFLPGICFRGYKSKRISMITLALFTYFSWVIAPQSNTFVCWMIWD
jgi:hypothetical protein